jgi:hypothetical protein
MQFSSLAFEFAGKALLRRLVGCAVGKHFPLEPGDCLTLPSLEGARGVSKAHAALPHRRKCWPRSKLQRGFAAGARLKTANLAVWPPVFADYVRFGKFCDEEQPSRRGPLPKPQPDQNIGRNPL